MKTLPCLLIVLSLVGFVLPLLAEEGDETTRAQWKRYLDDVAGRYPLTSEPDRQPLKILDRSTYTWARSGAHGGSYGSVHVWTKNGIAQAVGCVWRYPGEGKPDLVYELHSLSTNVLHGGEGSPDSWTPKAGVKRTAVPEAPAPAATTGARLQQMRAICRDFSARSVSESGERTELRLLPQPLYRYESKEPSVVDGALFAYVCSIGTDPELFLLLEAVNTDAGPKWQYAAARFSHMNLFVNYKDREVWQAVRDRENTLSRNADYTYWVFHRPFEPDQVQR